MGRSADLSGLSYGEIARRAGLSRSYVSRIMRGQRNPSLETLISLAKATGMSLDRLIEKLKAKSVAYRFLPR